MKEFFNKHPDSILAACGVLIVVVIVYFYTWGVGNIAGSLNEALNYVPPQNTVGYNLSTAQSLDWRGLVK
ncbi:MAG TPA: hypothetical protein VMU07_01130 [Candidatus Paceibacterota bacterium]|nr:hypothetical protein [Candidatus Paceibacterota bacterium]